MRRISISLIGSLLTFAVPFGASAQQVASAATPLQYDLGVFTGVDAFSSRTGLGNAYSVEDVPGAGPITGLHAGVVLLDGHLAVEGVFLNTFSTLRSEKASAQVMSGRIQGLWYFMTDGPVRPYAVIGGGVESFRNAKPGCEPGAVPTADNDCMYLKTPDTDKAFFVGAGARVPLTHRLAVRADARYLGTDGRPGDSKIANNFEALLGVVYAFGGRPEDSDLDGIVDDLDKCPLVAEDKDGFQDSDGCVDLDNDGDGIPDLKDTCVNEAEDYDQFKDDDGCPDPDNDGDGVLDATDKCPDKPETKNGYLDDDGCPDEMDADGDGVPDAKDRCPKEKEDKDGFADDDGCPEPDNDGDGILDARDKCPNQAEIKNGIDDEDGCPDDLAPAVKKLFDATVTSLEFKGAALQKSGDATLEPLLELLLEHEKLQVETAVQASDASDAARKLAEQRAQSVRSWFEDKGIEPGRLFAVAAPPGTASKPSKVDMKAVQKPGITFRLMPATR